MSRADSSVPQHVRRKHSRVMQNSLNLVQSFSRSQQLRYGALAIGSVPSFVAQDGDDDEDGAEDELDASFEEEPDEGAQDSSDFFFGHSTDEESTTPTRSAPQEQKSRGHSRFGAGQLFGFTPKITSRCDSLSPTQSPMSESGPSQNRSSVTTETTPLLSLQTPYKNSLSSHGVRRSSARKSSVASGIRRMSRGSASVLSRRKSLEPEPGESTDGQTLFNTVSILVGIGILSLPLAFAYMGWILGTIVLCIFGALCCHTAKLLARLIMSDPRLRGFTDLGTRAFGPWAGAAITLLFCLELFAYGLALIVLFGDTMNALFPSISPTQWKMIVFFWIVPTTLMPLRLLSIPSIGSTISSFTLVFVILIDGFSKSSAPGSILDPAQTDILPQLHGANWLGGIGIVLAGFGAHAVIPSLARDMKHPENFDKVMNKAFIITTIIGIVTGSAGYLMIGEGVSDEITRDLSEPMYGYPGWLNTLALWLIVVNPLTKFGLCSRPFNVTLESLLDIARTPYRPPEPFVPQPSRIEDTSQAIASTFSRVRQSLASPSRPRGLSRQDEEGRETNQDDDFAVHLETETPYKPIFGAQPPHTVVDTVDYHAWRRRERRKLGYRIFSRALVAACCTIAAIMVPGFGSVVAFMGSFSAFMIGVILPISFWLALSPTLHPEKLTLDERRVSKSGDKLERIGHYMILAISVCTMVAGTTWAFLSLRE